MKLVLTERKVKQIKGRNGKEVHEKEGRGGGGTERKTPAYRPKQVPVIYVTMMPLN
jgi:hypothetical protein